MRITKAVAAVIALMTAAPLALLLVMLVSAFAAGFGAGGHLAAPDPQLYQSLRAIIRALTVAWLILFAFYVLHLIRNPALEPARRTGWIAAFVVFGPIAELMYWRRYIWRGTPTATGSI